MRRESDRGDLPLLAFLEPSLDEVSVLVIENAEYLPALGKMFPKGRLYAVAAEREDAERTEYSGLGVTWDILDYRETALRYPKRFFDAVISERLLENVANPQDIASGIGTFIKDTGALLTSFENIRHVRVLREIMEGHYYAIVRRRYAKPEFERLLLASFYKDVFFIPVRRRDETGDVDRLMAAGFTNSLNDLETEVWLVKAARSSGSVAALKAEYTPKIRKRISLLMRRIEYGIDAGENAAALWDLAEKEGISSEFLGRFAAEAVFHRGAFFEALYKWTPPERLRDAKIMERASETARRDEK